jgi:hypothetical protein
VQREHPDAAVEVWTMDEHRIGLKPVLRRVWRRRGTCAVLPVQPRYEWLYLYGFVRPSTGQTWWLLLPTVSIEAMTLALQEWARDVGIGQERRCVLVLDRAGWHMSGQVELPEGIHLEALPAYSPELQPAERLWTLTDEGIANRHFGTIEEL